MAEPLRTRREKAHYGDRVIVGGIPVVRIKAGTKNDYMTAGEVIEDLYGAPIQCIMLKDGTILNVSNDVAVSQN